MTEGKKLFQLYQPSDFEIYREEIERFHYELQRDGYVYIQFPNEKDDVVIMKNLVDEAKGFFENKTFEEKKNFHDLNTDDQKNWTVPIDATGQADILSHNISEESNEPYYYCDYPDDNYTQKYRESQGFSIRRFFSCLLGDQRHSDISEELNVTPVAKARTPSPDDKAVSSQPNKPDVATNTLKRKIRNTATSKGYINRNIEKPTREIFDIEDNDRFADSTFTEVTQKAYKQMNVYSSYALLQALYPLEYEGQSYIAQLQEGRSNSKLRLLRYYYQGKLCWLRELSKSSLSSLFR
jgi:hypothetical protein